MNCLYWGNFMKKDRYRNGKFSKNIINSILLIVISLTIFLSMFYFSIYPLKILEMGNTPIFIETWSDEYIESWNRTWGSNETDYGKGIAVDSDQNIYIVGRTYNEKSYKEGLGHMFLLKYSLSGTLIWEKQWSDPCYGTGIAVDLLGNIYLSGVSSTFETSHDFYLSKVNSSGAILWNKSWGGSEMDYSEDIALDSSGNIYVFGTTNSYGSGSGDAALVKYNSSGNLIWNKTWGTAGFDEGHGVVLDGLDNIYITGIADASGGDEGELFLVKYNNSGTISLNETWGRPYRDEGYDIVLDKVGNIYITGVSHRINTTDLLIVKYNNNVEEVWNRTWGDWDHEAGFRIALDSSENIFITGTENDASSSDQFAILLNYDSSGSLLWNKTWEGNPFLVGYGLVISSLDDIYITGEFDSELKKKDNFLIKFSKPSTTTSPIPSFSFLNLVFIIIAVVIIAEGMRKKRLKS